MTIWYNYIPYINTSLKIIYCIMENRMMKAQITRSAILVSLQLGSGPRSKSRVRYIMDALLSAGM